MTGDDPGSPGKQTLAEEVAPAVAELHAEGHGRNAISRALGVSTFTVSGAARIAGVEFDTAGTEAATRSRAEQLAEDRADLAGMSAELARRAGRRLYMELGATVLDPATVTALNRTYGTAVDKLAVLTETLPDDRDDLERPRLWLDALKAQVTAAQLGLIEPNADGTTPLVLGSEHLPPDHHDHTTTEGEHNV